MTQTIVPHLWFEKDAKGAAEFYASVFDKHSHIVNTSTIEGTPSGSVDIVSFHLRGHEFMAIGAGPLFKFNPSISFHVRCKSVDEVDAIWKKLAPGGAVLMELGSYPWSDRYGWLSDKYGLSWQIAHFSDAAVAEKVTPVLMFTGQNSGKAEEAAMTWTAIFGERGGRGHTSIGNVQRYGKGEEPEKEGTIKYASLSLLGQEFGVMDSARDHGFTFNEAISFIVNCETQEEIDYYWEKLSAVPEAEQCGWLKDKYGVSWQIVPTAMERMMSSSDNAAKKRLTEAFLKMKKFDIAALEAAYQGR